MPESKRPVSIKGILFKHNDANPEVLLLRNEREEWDLPGGKIEDKPAPPQVPARWPNPAREGWLQT
jgi:8-oxo-dGTP pyrophosphatase MutT (NUDIX family)